MSLAVTLAGLALALGGIFLAGALVYPVVDRTVGVGDDTESLLLVSDLTKWVATAAVVAFVLVVEGQPLASIGWQVPPRTEALVAVGGGLAVMLAIDRITGPVFDALGIGGVGETMAGLGALSLPRQIAIAVTAGVTEEVLFRGYPIERIAELTGSPLLGGAVATAAFVLVHYGFWDRDEVIRIAVPAVLLTGLYLVVRSLQVVIAVHVLNDVVGLLVARGNADDVPEGDEESEADGEGPAGAEEKDGAKATGDGQRSDAAAGDGAIDESDAETHDGGTEEDGDQVEVGGNIDEDGDRDENGGNTDECDATG